MFVAIGALVNEAVGTFVPGKQRFSSLPRGKTARDFKNYMDEFGISVFLIDIEGSDVLYKARKDDFGEIDELLRKWR